MAERRKYQQSLTVIDGVGAPVRVAAGASVQVYRASARVTQVSSYPSSSTVTVDHPGGVEAGNVCLVVQGGVENAVQVVVTAVTRVSDTEWTLTISATIPAASSVDFAIGDRLVSTASVTLYAGPSGLDTLSNPVTVDAAGMFSFYTTRKDVDLEVSGSGVDVSWFHDVATDPGTAGTVVLSVEAKTAASLVEVSEGISLVVTNGTTAIDRITACSAGKVLQLVTSQAVTLNGITVPSQDGQIYSNTNYTTRAYEVVTLVGVLVSGYYVWARSSTTVSGLSIDDLSDVDTSGVALNEVLTWDGAQWVAAAPPGSSGGEANTISTVAGTHSWVSGKVGVDLQLLGFDVSSKLTVTAGAGKLTLDVDETAVDHDQLLNYSADQHRVINDAGTGLTELWSANRISTQLAGKAALSHTHATTDINFGTLPTIRGGTGNNSWTANRPVKVAASGSALESTSVLGTNLDPISAYMSLVAFMQGGNAGTLQPVSLTGVRTWTLPNISGNVLIYTGTAGADDMVVHDGTQFVLESRKKRQWLFTKELDLSTITFSGQIITFGHMHITAQLVAIHTDGFALGGGISMDLNVRSAAGVASMAAATNMLTGTGISFDAAADGAVFTREDTGFIVGAPTSVASANHVLALYVTGVAATGTGSGLITLVFEEL